MGFSAPAELGMGAVQTARRSKRIDTKVSILLGLQFPLFLSLAKIGERRPLRKCGTAVGLLLRLFRNLFAVHRYLTATHVVYSTQVRHTVLPYGRKNSLPRPYSLSSANFAVPSQGKGVIHKRVENRRLSTLLCARAASAQCPRRNRRRSLRFASETLSGFHRKIKSQLPKTPLLF